MNGKVDYIQEILTSNPIPPLANGQIKFFSIESLRARKVQDFDPKIILDKLQSHEELKVYGVDIGGDKITSAFFTKEINSLNPQGTPEIMQSNKGEGYLDFLKKIAKKAKEENLGVGISLAATVSGNKLIEGGSNLDFLITELKAEFENDFSKIFEKIIVVNDAVAGLMSGVVQAQEKYPDTIDAVFLINGSGLNTAVLKNNEIWAGEMGHVNIDSKLNPHNQEKICNLYAADYVCIENIASSKAGIEDIWLQKTRQYLSGREISGKMQSGEKLAIELYDNSAVLSAHMVMGISSAFEVLKDKKTAIICHGGTFNVPGYPERIEQVLEEYLGFRPNIIFTKDYSQNACLDGAAISALTLS